MNWKIGSHSFHISLTMLALAAGALFVYAKFGNSAATDTWLALAHQEATSLAAFKARTANLESEATALQAQAAHARASAAFFQDSMGTLEEVFDSLIKAAQTPIPGTAPVTLGQIGDACHGLLEVCKHRGDSLAHADSLDLRADSLDRARADANFARALHADSVIALGVKATSCHFLLLFPCPSREQAFLGGAGLALILRAVVTR